jgi:TPR repeat protein
VLSQSEAAKLELKLKTHGSIPAALALARDAVENLTEKPEAMRARRDYILEHEHKGSREVVGILCLISAYLGDYKFCDHFLEAVESAGDPYFGYELCRILRSQQADPSKSQEYLRRSARAGYLPARKELVRLKMRQLGPVGWIGNVAHSVYLSMIATVLFWRDSRDRRLPRV